MNQLDGWRRPVKSSRAERRSEMPRPARDQKSIKERFCVRSGDAEGNARQVECYSRPAKGCPKQALRGMSIDAEKGCGKSSEDENGNGSALRWMWMRCADRK